MQPLLRLITPSLAPAISSASMLIAPKSLTTAASRRPSACASRWFTTVVLPAPRKPVTSRIGTGIISPRTSELGNGPAHRPAGPRRHIQHAIGNQRLAADHQMPHAL